MRPHLLTALLLGILASFTTISLAQTPVPQINYKQLREHPFEAHGLKIAIQTFNAGHFSANLTNTTSSFIAFAPEDMALVDKTGSQLFLNSELSTYGTTPMTPPRLRIAPGATVHLGGLLNDGETFPVKVYYFDTLCAIVTAD